MSKDGRPRYLTVRNEAGTAKDYRRVVARDSYCAAYISWQVESTVEGLVITCMRRSRHHLIIFTYIITHQRLNCLF